MAGEPAATPLSLQQQEQQEQQQEQQPEEELIVTTFKWPRALGGHEVAVAGTFNGWAAALPLGRAPSGDFVRSLALPPAGVQFKFLVDGEWVASPCERVAYGGGGAVNNYRRGAGLGEGGPPRWRPGRLAAHARLRCLPAGGFCQPWRLDAPALLPQSRGCRLVQATATFTWPSSALGGREVLLAGDWAAWAELLPMGRDPATGNHVLRCCLPPGSYQYQFLVDGAWRLCPDSPTAQARAARVCRCRQRGPSPAPALPTLARRCSLGLRHALPCPHHAARGHRPFCQQRGGSLSPGLPHSVRHRLAGCGAACAQPAA